MLDFDVCLVVRCAVCVCVGFLERMCMSDQRLSTGDLQAGAPPA